MRDYPQIHTPVDRVEPVPRRIRARLNGKTVLDTTAALYVWEWPNYPHYYIPVADIDTEFVVDEEHTHRLRRGSVRRHGLRVGSADRPGSVRVFTDDSQPGLAGMARIDWTAVDSWFEEDEEVFVHPRDPYTRVDALRSTRSVRIELDGFVLAESASPVMVFETGLPTRYYLNRAEVDFGRLTPTATVTSCPYKGTTTGYWSITTGSATYADLAWSYDFPTRELLPIAGLVAFYNEKVDVFVEGRLQDRPITHFFR